MINRLNSEFKTLQTSLELREQRQQLLSSNIANADTPNYKARDFDFTAALKQATGMGPNTLPAPALAMTSDRHIPGVGVEQSGLNPNVQYRTPYQQAMDGNTVEMDVERVAFAENTLQTQSNITFINARFKSLMAALQSN